MKVTPVFTLLLSLALTASSCKKDAPEAGLPPATQEGRNTGGCLINGERFVATGWGGSLLSNPIPPLFGGFSFDSVYRVELNGQYRGQNATVMLFLKARKSGTYQLNQNTQYYPQGDPLVLVHHATFDVADSKGEVYVTNARNTGQVILTRADKPASIGAGTFEFTAASPFDPKKTVTITSGRFDRQQ